VILVGNYLHGFEIEPEMGLWGAFLAVSFFGGIFKYLSWNQ